MADLKELKSITQSELTGKLHIEQPDSPERGTRGMQELFDAHPNLNTQTINLNAQRQNANNAAIMGQMETMRDELTEVIDAGGKTVNEHKADLNNPHKVTKAQVGLGGCDNTSDLDKPVSTAVQAALDLKANEADIQPQIDAGGAALDTHKKDALNPHKVTKAQVGLGDCDNTSDLDKPVSTAVQAALDLKANEADIQPRIDAGGAALDTHKKDALNPHKVTKAQVGLGDCDNTSDLDKPVSTAVQTALDLKADTAYVETLLEERTTQAQASADAAALSASYAEAAGTKAVQNAAHAAESLQKTNDLYDKVQSDRQAAARSASQAQVSARDAQNAADRAAYLVTPAQGFFALSVRADGHLVASYPQEDAPPAMQINASGHLILTV